MHRVIFKASAQKSLDELPLPIQKKVARAIDDLVRMGIHARQVKKLHPPIGGYRMRVGEHRILFDREDDIILVHRISRRATAY
jgi:mRNA-degrading endonuclease RelE of RelBE toxin-antitoxin system